MSNSQTALDDWYRNAFSLNTSESEQCKTNAQDAEFAQYKSIVDQSKVIMFQCDRFGHWVFLNQAWTEHLGHPTQACLGRSYLDFVFESDRSAHQAALRPLLRRETDACSGEFRYIDSMSSAIYLEFNARVVLNQNSEVESIIGTLIEVSDRRAAQEQLQRKESYQRALIDNFPFLVWLKDTDGRFLAVNQRLAEAFGLDNPAEMEGRTDFEFSPHELASAYRKDDQEVMDSLSKKYVEEEVVDQGARQWAETYKAPVLNAAGELLGTVGFARDISNRKQHEEDLRLAASVFTHASEGIMITDAEGYIVDVNQAFTMITGFPKSDVVQRKPDILNSGRHDQDFFAGLWRQILKEGYWSGEVWNRCANQAIVPHRLTISAVRSQSGEFKHFVGLLSNISAEVEYKHQLEKIAHYDALTGLPNRVLISRKLKEALQESQAEGSTVGVGYLDLDGFKSINDNFGHEAGDILLVKIAKRLEEALREKAIIGRLGGDEFVVLMPGMSAPTSQHPALASILDEAAKSELIHGKHLKVSASLGVTFYPLEEEVDADQLLRQADQAMYQAKLSGKNRLCVFDQEEDRSQRGHHESLAVIRKAMQNNEFELFYQPKIKMRTGHLHGAEALARWRHPEKGVLAPMTFLPIIENHPLSILFGEWVIEKSIQQFLSWERVGLQVPVSINMSAYQFQQENFVERLEDILSLYPEFPPGMLELEILETSSMEDIEHVSKIMRHCKRLGVKFALDDFGTGYSSLTYLKRLPVDTLKIDQSFVRGMLKDPEDLAILEGVLNLSDTFGREVIAEGVETVEHGELLLRLGCELAQGYAIAKPLPADEFLDWSRSWVVDISWSTTEAIEPICLPLIIAGVELSAWSKRVLLACPEDIHHEIENFNQLRFTRWMKREGQSRFAGNAHFQDLGHIHLKLFLIARDYEQALKQDRENPDLTGTEMEKVIALFQKEVGSLLSPGSQHNRPRLPLSW